LDSPLRSLALRDPDLADLIGTATRTTFSRIIDLCLDEKVDALVIAGDLYDGEQTSMKTARFLAGELGRLADAGIATYIIRGNHDSLSRITRELVLPDTVKLFGGRAECVTINRGPGEKPVAIHGLSFSDTTAPESLLPRFKPAVADAINVGILHTSLGGAPGHDPYAPCSPADLHATGYNYWALGHIHKRAVIEGASTIVMPGIPQGRDINEDGPKSVTLVSIDDDQTVTLEEKRLALAEFQRVRINAGQSTEWEELVLSISAGLEQVRKNASAAELVVRLELTGTTPLAWRMRRDADVLLAECQQRASRIGSVWIEKLELDCQPPGATASPGADPLVELQTLIADRVLESEGFNLAYNALAEQLQAQLPTDLRDLFGSTEAQSAQTLQDLSRDGAADVFARLRAGSSDGAS
jgi:exonuclease SbcD